MRTIGKELGSSSAIWYKKKNRSPCEDGSSAKETAKAELHFNLWHCKKSKFLCKENLNCFIDIGILLFNYEDIQEIFIYIPFPVKTEDLKDLSEKLDKQTLDAIFNEDISTTTDSEGECIKMNMPSSNDENSSIILWRLDHSSTSNSDLSVVSDYNRKDSIFKISENAVSRARDCLEKEDNRNGNERIYFRLRVELNKVNQNPFVQTVKPNDNKLLSGFDRLEFVDFRLNERRNLPDAISRTIHNTENSYFDVSQIHFLLATDVNADYVSAHRQFSKCRMLENTLWNAYTDKRLTSHMVVYHWKAYSGSEKGGSKKGFNAFLKFRTRESSLQTISRYCIISIIFGFIGSYILNLITNYF